MTKDFIFFHKKIEHRNEEVLKRDSTSFISKSAQQYRGNFIFGKLAVSGG